MTANVLVVGASGLVGSALFREFGAHTSTIGTFCHNAFPGLFHLDLCDRDEVRSVLHDFCPKFVLCPAAEPSVERCEIEPMATRRVNVDGLRNLLAAAEESKVVLVYFSSEYVFDGTQGPYSETSTCNPLNEYGRQKLVCERMIAARQKQHIIARISGVYGWDIQRKNFVMRLIDTLKAGQTFKVANDQIITPTYAPNLARAVRRLIDSGSRGLYHLCGSLPMLRMEFAYLIARVFQLDASLIVPVVTAQLGLRAARPRSAEMRIDKATALLDFPIACPQEGLEAMKLECAAKVTAG